MPVILPFYPQESCPETAGKNDPLKRIMSGLENRVIGTGLIQTIWWAFSSTAVDVAPTATHHLLPPDVHCFSLWLLASSDLVMFAPSVVSQALQHQVKQHLLR